MLTTTMDARRVKQRKLRGRRLVVVDLENLVGGAVICPDAAYDGWRALDSAVGVRPEDQVVVGASHISAIAAWRARQSARVVVRSGANGADLALLDVLTDEDIASRFDEVVIASGDGIFTDAAALLGASGVSVTVVSREGHLARSLRMSAGVVVLLAQDARSFGDAA